MGFGDVGADDKKLQFDLTESARAARAAKRATLSWQDFSAAGFSRTDAPLHATLQFSAPVQNTVNTWPAQSAEIHRKLKKTQKALPAFGWDIEPVVGAEEVIEEGFIDVFCDLIYGGGWMDVERIEEVDRECNWALVEFKSLPVTRPTTFSGNADPRTASTVILFEEFVPLEYRQQLNEAGRSRKRLPSLFGNSSRKQWKPAPTLNGRPYVVGHVPHSPSYREVEFEGLLRSEGSATKILTLKTPDRREGAPSNTSVLSPFSSTLSSPITTQPLPHLFLTPPTQSEAPLQRTTSRNSNNTDQSNGRPSTPSMPTSPTGSRKSSRFRLPQQQASRGAQDASMRDALKGGRSDPELASQEVSEVLAAVRGQLPSDDEDDDDIVPMHEGQEYFDERDSEADRDTISGPRVLVEDEDDSPAVSIRSKRGLGYFDLHPERRAQLQPDEDDTSLRPARSHSPLRLERTSLEDPRTRFERPSLEVSEESAYDDASDVAEPGPSSPAAPLPPPKEGRSEENSNGRSSSPRATPAASSSAAEPAKPAQSKTASLIEMYRERERGTSTTPGAVPPSRLPVRTGASLTPNSVSRDRSPSPRPRTPVESQSSPSIDSIELDDSLLEPPRRMGHDDIGLMTPSRYVHGAPLHNVLEEPEEEEEEE
ncbi:hypothetical protein NM688_g9086 [Phlebia brevispora]|uniref:Uncharacterized protein n=1 Tax=Phlebia brevispora TaxID=194682 RepID=A0ACC1RJM1_9APHY|nr:hypothetical protein NM688_g9086 [Phlebia brevispora]